VKNPLSAYVVFALLVASSACGAPLPRPAASSVATQSASPALQSANTYLRPVDRVTYTLMAPDVERQLTSFVADKATTYAFRDVALAGSPAKLRLVVIQMTDAYAATKPLDELHGMGGPNAYPDRKLIAGLPSFLHTDVTPNFLAWQQRQILALVYGTDRVAMESLATSLVLANR
jgi:hypothetical protein